MFFGLALHMYSMFFFINFFLHNFSCMHFAHPHNFSKGPPLTNNNYIT